jgi:hypothetical protein
MMTTTTTAARSLYYYALLPLSNEVELKRARTLQTACHFLAIVMLSLALLFHQI